MGGFAAKREEEKTGDCAKQNSLRLLRDNNRTALSALVTPQSPEPRVHQCALRWARFALFLSPPREEDGAEKLLLDKYYGRAETRPKGSGQARALRLGLSNRHRRRANLKSI